MAKNDLQVSVDVEEVGRYIGSAIESINNALNQVEGGEGLKSKSISLMMMAYGSATSAQNLLAACNALIIEQSDELKESVWEDFKNAAVLAQAASQMIERAAQELGFEEALDFRDARAEGIEADHYRELLDDFRYFERFHMSATKNDSLN